MSSPRVIASFLVMAATASVIASCSEQPLPTAATPFTLPQADPPGTLPQAVPQSGVPGFATGVPRFVDMLADPLAPVSGARATTPIAYAPGAPPDPWPPGPPPKAQPGVPVPTEPTASPQMHIVIDPDPVMHSGVAVPIAGCENNPYTWYYSQMLVNDSGLSITFTSRENFFDGRYSSTNPQVVTIPAKGTVTLDTRWCSAYAKPHYAQTRFKGRDQKGQAVVISAPWAALLAP